MDGTTVIQNVIAASSNTSSRVRFHPNVASTIAASSFPNPWTTPRSSKMPSPRATKFIEPRAFHPSVESTNAASSFQPVDGTTSIKNAPAASYEIHRAACIENIFAASSEIHRAACIFIRTLKHLRRFFVQPRVYCYVNRRPPSKKPRAHLHLSRAPSQAASKLQNKPRIIKSSYDNFKKQKTFSKSKVIRDKKPRVNFNKAAHHHHHLSNRDLLTSKGDPSKVTSSINLTKPCTNFFISR